jgi:predicted lipoprotein
VVPHDALRAEEDTQVFQAVDYVTDFWTAKLIPALAEAADAEPVLAALRESPEKARTQFGRSVGLGRSSLYFLRGSGTIVSVDDKQIGVSLSDAISDADVVLVTDLLFGNTVRDATGLIRGDDFSNSQHFSEVSTELNRVVESTIIPRLKQQAKVGAAIKFVGCAEVTNAPRDVTPLKVIPLDVEFQ